MIKIAAAQLATLAISSARLDYYLKLCKNEGVSLVVFGEYVINSFFTELIKMPKSMIKEQSKIKKASLLELAKKYQLELIAPFISVDKTGFKKLCLKVNEKGLKSYEQQALISYNHWNEAKFFKNSLKSFKLFSFKHQGLKCALIFGFEAHFDIFWKEIREKKIDVVLIPSASAFGSKERWRALLQTKALLASTSIVRVNRIGKLNEEWIFYGDSLHIDAFGQIQDNLGEEEGLLICEITSSKEARKLWGFDKIARSLEKAKYQ